MADKDRAKNRAAKPKVGQKKKPYKKGKVINQRAKTARMDDSLFLCWGCKRVFDGGKILVETQKGKVPFCAECCEARGYQVDAPPVEG
jgi:hypothetical protein